MQGNVVTTPPETRQGFALLLLASVWLALPSLCAVQTGRFDALFLLASLAPVLFVLGCGGPRGSVAVVARALLAGAVGVLNLLYAVSVVTQGTGFNAQFFFYLDASAVSFVFDGMPEFAWAASVLLLGQVLLTATVRPRRGTRSGRLVTAAVVLLAVSPPVTSLTRYALEVGRRERAYGELLELLTRRRTHPPTTREPESPRNIVLVYMESLERDYMDPELFGYDLAPGLRELMASGQDFTEIRQVVGTGWTAAGLFSSQCGLPLQSRVKGNRVLAELDLGLGGCLAHLLSDTGYHTVYMGGASSAVAGSGAMLRASGYDVVLGREELEHEVDPGYLHEWGLYDDSLFALALDELDALYAAERPFLLTLLTIDTHFPIGFVSRSCALPEGLEGDFETAIYCSAQLITTFVRDVLARDPDGNTLVVLFSDHLTMQIEVPPELKRKRHSRRLSFALLAPWLEPEQIDRPGTHFDVAPTILEAVGLKDFGDFPLGQSLLSHSQAFVLDRGVTLDQLQHFEILDLPTSAPAARDELATGGPERAPPIGDVPGSQR